MTLAEIYSAITNLVYGDIAAAPVPTAEVPFIQTLILNKHKEIQDNYNFWFMRAKADISLIAGSDTYALPDDYKQMISLTYEGENYDKEFQFIVDDIYFPEAPEEDKDITMDYWKYIPTPAWADDTSDVVTQYCNWPIIYMVTAMLMLKREEKNAAGMYSQLAAEALNSSYAEDYSRRQAAGVIF